MGRVPPGAKIIMTGLWIAEECVKENLIVKIKPHRQALTTRVGWGVTWIMIIIVRNIAVIIICIRLIMVDALYWIVKKGNRIMEGCGGVVITVGTIRWKIIV
jgi:hypothetical protein